MARQIEPELLAWYTRRKALRDQFDTALASKDFAPVETVQYADEDSQDTPYPQTTEMETKLLTEMRNLATTEMTADDAISITLQVNTLESFRRAYLSQKQTKRDLLRHLAQKVAHEQRFDDLMLQQFTDTDKVLGQS